MADSDTTLLPGVDYTALFGGYATALQQGIERATPNGLRGFAYYSETQPPVVGQPSGYQSGWYIFNKRGPWIQPSTGAVYGYKTGVGWVNSATQIPAGTITTAMLADGSVTVDKISPLGGSAGQVPTISTDGLTVEYATPLANIATGSFAPNKITPGTSNQFLRTIGGITTWDTFDGNDIAALLQISQLPASYLSPGLPYQVLATDSLGNFPAWTNVQDTLLDNTIPVTKLSAGTGNASKVLGVNSSGTGFEFVSTGVSANVLTAAFASPVLTLASGVAAAHSLGGFPTVVSAFVKCAVAEHGYTIGDIVPLEQTSCDYDTGARDGQWISITCDATNYKVTLNPFVGSGTEEVFIQHKSTGTNSVLTIANWRLQFYLYAP